MLNSKTKILVSCPNENHEPYYVKWGNFLSGKRCPKCKSEKLSETLAALQRPQIYQIADQMDSPPTETSKGESYTEGFMA